MTGRPESNSTPSSTTSAAAARSRSGCPTMARSRTKPVGGAGDAGVERTRFVGDAYTLCRLFKAGDRLLHRLFRLASLRFDELRWNAAHDGTRDHRIVDEGHAQHVRFECVGHRYGEIAGRIIRS